MGLVPYRDAPDFHKHSSGLHPTLSDISLSAIKMSVGVANHLKRRWIGMDITYQSVALILKRLKDSEGQAAVDGVELHGVPKDMESVDALIHKKDDRVRKESEKWTILTYSYNFDVINKEKGANG
ncbi:MAG TPA: hypothetical protein VNI84_01945 [Pyrinomonadaceae bacterium]|nr:hypothetical protein [Pyrinomonadaceae bacterium]